MKYISQGELKRKMEFIMGVIAGIIFSIVISSSVYMTFKYGETEFRVQGICKFIKLVDRAEK